MLILIIPGSIFSHWQCSAMLFFGLPQILLYFRDMVPILYGNSVISAPVRSNIFYLIHLRHLIRPRAVTNRFFDQKIFFPWCRATCSKWPIIICTMHLDGFECTLSLISAPPASIWIFYYQRYFQWEATVQILRIIWIWSSMRNTVLSWFVLNSE